MGEAEREKGAEWKNSSSQPVRKCHGGRREGGGRSWRRQRVEGRTHRQVEARSGYTTEKAGMPPGKACPCPSRRCV